MKFQYSPGLFGYGPQGADGSEGILGAAFYFTDYNPISDFLRINSAIENDEVLLSKVLSGTKLPNGRTYNTGDLVMAVNGDVYEIDAETNELGDMPIGSLSKVDFFDKYHEIYTDNEYERWANYYNASTNYIIDNVMSTTPGIIYTTYPSNIYGIQPKNFARIEYTNVINSSYNSFSVYSSGENFLSDDNKAIAIVKSSYDRLFRIGNLDDDANIRNVSLILDVSSLIHTKETGNTFSIDASLGNILTNKEISTNILFDPVLIRTPTSFKAITGATDVSIEWNLSDFTSDTDITASLFFYKKQDPSGSYNISNDTVNPLMLYDLDSSGTVNFSGLTLGLTYQYYIVIDKDGWERMSSIKNVTTSSTIATLTVNDPSSLELNADASGWFSSISNYTYTVDISTDSVTGWNVTDIALPSWITITPTSGPAGDDTFDVSLYRKTDPGSREGLITISSQAEDVSIKVTQTGTIGTTIYFNNDGSILIDDLSEGSAIDISLMAYGKSYAQSRDDIAISSIYIYHKRKGGLDTLVNISATSGIGEDPSTSITYGYLNAYGFTDNSVNEVYYLQEPATEQDDTGAWRYSTGYMRITNAEIDGESINVPYNTFRIYADGTTLARNE